MAAYLRPSNIEEAVAHLSTAPYALVAGCTDYYCQPRRSLDEPILDITRIREARGIVESMDGGFRLGALTTWTQIADAELPPQFDALKEAARQIGGANPEQRHDRRQSLQCVSAADGVPPLLALDARVELRSAMGVRTVPLAQFIIGNRRTARRSDEMLTASIVCRSGADATPAASSSWAPAPTK